MTASIKNQIINEIDIEIEGITDTISVLSDPLKVTLLRVKRDTLEDIKKDVMNLKSTNTQVINRVYNFLSVSMIEGNSGVNSGVMRAMEILSHYR